MIILSKDRPCASELSSLMQMFEDLKQADRRPLLKFELKSGYFFLPGLCTFFQSN